jgi:serpin B
MRLLPMLPLLAMPLVSAACDPPPAGAPSSAQPAPGSPEAVAPQLAPASGPDAAPPSSDELAAMARGDNAFALDLYGKARAQKGNLAMSPLSIAAALTMTWAGARGETAAQMKKVLHIDGAPDRAIDVAGKLVAGYEAPGASVTLRVANRLFGAKGYAFDPAYLDHVKAAFGAPLEPLDFAGATDDARRRINAWIAQQTQDRIKDLVPSGGLTSQTRLVLTNAIYFLGDWAQPFKQEATGPAPFFAAPTASKDVPTMHQTASFRFASSDGVELLEMPYQGGGLAMTLALPAAADGLDAVEARLSPAVLDAWIGALAPTKVVVSLPKIVIDPADALSLGGLLVALGMPLAFDADRADFTGMTRPPAPADRLYLSKVFHKAFVKVDEKGTEAAAATAVVMTPKSVMRPVQPPVEFKADHPFLFFLRDTRSGVILFMGRVSDPAAS